MTINQRQGAHLASACLTNGVNRDLFIGWQEIYLAAASLLNGASGLAASLSVATLSASNLNALRFTATSHSGNGASGFPVWITKPVPQDAAIELPASGSGTLYIDWTDPTTAQAVAVIAACLFLVPNGCPINAAGASTLAATCATITGGAVSQLNSTSLVQFNAPTTRDGFLAIKIGVAANDRLNTSGSNFHMFGIRLRYKADRIGS